jgi:hypothetical protein
MGGAPRTAFFYLVYQNLLIGEHSLRSVERGDEPREKGETTPENSSNGDL